MVVRLYMTYCALFFIGVCYRVESMELVGNYKFHRFISDTLIYDATGNHNHGEYSSKNFYYSDRGLMINNVCILKFPSKTFKAYPGYKDFTVSYWFLRKNVQRSRYFSMVNSTTDIKVYLSLDNLQTNILIDKLNIVTKETINIHLSNNGFHDLLDKWRFYTFKFTQDASNTASSISIYINLVHIFTINIPNFSVDFESAWMLGGNVYLYGIMYELWWHVDVRAINQLETYMNQCACSYGCVTSPTILCLPLHDGTQNYDGLNCTPCLESCSTELKCIGNFKTECMYGLYDRHSDTCLLYCPDNSCIFSSSEFISCKSGFKKVSDHFPACLPFHCSEYSVLYYEYTCYKCDIWYLSDYDRDCSICDRGYTEVSLDPIVCIKILNCLTYIQVGDSYLCSTCGEGYQIDAEAECKQCDEGYENILEGSFTCVLKIENCSIYLQYGDAWKCEECKQGYKDSSSGLCDECQSGYIRISSESITCKPEIPYCIEYDTTSEDSICLSFENGYITDSKHQFTVCEVGYISVALSPLKCAKKIANCREYTLYEYDWVCKECNQGYVSLETESIECVKTLDSNCIPESEDCPNQTSQTQSESISGIQKARAASIQFSTTVSIGVSTGCTSIGALLSFNPSTY